MSASEFEKSPMIQVRESRAGGWPTHSRSLRMCGVGMRLALPELLFNRHSAIVVARIA